MSRRIWIGICSVVLTLAVVSAAVAPVLDLTDNDLLLLAQGMRDRDNKPERFFSEPNFQEHTTVYGKQQPAPETLFMYTPRSVYETSPYKEFVALKPLYKPLTSVYDGPTPAREAAINEFLEAVGKHPTFLYFSMLLAHKKYPLAHTWPMFKEVLHKMWFTEYSRGPVTFPNSCGFEHAFLGELNSTSVLGLHNWVTFSLRETDPEDPLRYGGYVTKRTDVIASMDYYWRKRPKFGGSFFLTSSPAFDLALYTACFLARRGKECRVVIDDCEVFVETMQRADGLVDTAFPSTGTSSVECGANFKQRRLQAAAPAA